MIIAFFFVAIFGAFLKMASKDSSSIWASFMAYIFALIIQIILVSRKGISFLKTKRFFGHVGRAFFGALATILYIISMKYIPLLNATLLFNTTPLFIPILAIFMLKAKISWKVWCSIVIGFIGVIFILKPGIGILDHPGAIIGLGSGLCLATAFIFIKILTSTEPPERIIFYFFFLGTCFFVPILFFAGEVPSFTYWAWGLGAGASFILTQFFIVKAYTYADPHDIGAFQYVSVIFAGLIGWIFWDRIPTDTDIIGVILVIIGGILAILLSEHRKAA